MPDNQPNIPAIETTPQLSDQAKALDRLRETVTRAYGDELWTAIHTGIAVIGSLSFKGLANPVSLLYEGGSGRGKSTIINILNPDRDSSRKYVYRLDNFTPHSFVSHAANVKKEDIAKIDLLPQIKDKALLVKELAPLFRGREDELRANFAILTSVLDGKGYVSASGVHGKRGYDGEYVFNWLGATTPIPAKTDSVMAQLGNRILRYEIVGSKQSEDELVEFALSFEPETEEAACRKATNDFLGEHFVRHPLRTVEPSSVMINKQHCLELVRLSKLIAQGRVEITKVQHGSGSSAGEEEFIPGLAEGEHRIIVYLRTIAQALALVGERSEVGRKDMEVVRHIAFSTITHTRREVLRAVLVGGGDLDAATAERTLGVTRPTARSRMREVAATGIVRWNKSNGSVAESITLADEWEWLVSPEATLVATDFVEAVPAAPESRVPLWVMSQPFQLQGQV
jgi:hypothetical protein